MTESLKKNKGERQPKRIIHFSDGDVSEYSSEDDDSPDGTVPNCVMQIDPGSLGWINWLRFKTTVVGNVAIQVCDYLGNSLSSFFGITTPKYQFEIDHFNMMKKMESEFSDTEMGCINNTIGKNSSSA